MIIGLYKNLYPDLTGEIIEKIITNDDKLHKGFIIIFKSGAKIEISGNSEGNTDLEYI